MQKTKNRWLGILLLLLLPFSLNEEEEVVELETYTAEDEIEDDFGVLPREPVNSVFGFDKTALETPRSVSSVSAEFLETFDVTSINDISTFIPGSFTTSFFGVAGSLDIRGTPADNYFRGVKRIANDGVYPTPIGASDRIDVIRGPMSPISGPSRVAGALNFIPKSARAETGQYMSEAAGTLSYTTGSWDKSILRAEVGGPMSIADKTAGYYVFAEIEDSGSYYRLDFTKQTLLQGSFNVDLSDNTRIEFGGMYQKWDGHENGGWNRVTQELIDTGTYVTGQPNHTPPDANGDGWINWAEIINIDTGFSGAGFGTNVACFGDFQGFANTGSTQLFCPGPFDPADLDVGSIPTRDGVGIYGITPTGTAQLDGSQVLITYEDLYKTDALTLYLDFITEYESGWTMTNKFFYDEVKSANSDAYGFSKTGDSWLFEYQLIFSKMFENDSFTANVSLSPSLRYIDAFYANDFFHEIFDRVDLTVGFNPSSRVGSNVLLGPELEPWGINDFAETTQIGLAALADVTFGNLNVVLGGRIDSVEIDAETGDPARFFRRTAGAVASNSDEGYSYTASLSYKISDNIIPYVTVSEQSTVLFGTHDSIELAFVDANEFLGESTMEEAGIKANFLDGRLFVAGSVFEQERISINQNGATESNEALRSDGFEIELRVVPTENTSIVATYTDLEVVRTDVNGVWFTFLGAADFPQLDPSLIWGGVFGGNVLVDDEPARGGIPETIISLSATARFSDALSGAISLSSVDEVFPSPTGNLVLPAYDKVDLSLTYATPTFTAKASVNNLTDEQYFRANFPGLYGNLVVLPEKPVNYTFSVTYRF
ncbi:MAG: TonB-dependent receptor plug domain-containing protein [Pseudomonadales bacterium]|nr:TonB-dependent receptor plug domain-containing protein [Pseudomonadales bacterium]